MLNNQAHEGPQPPSILEERKGLKDAQHVAHAHSVAHPHSPRTRGAISASLEGSCRDPSTASHISASLEGSEPTLERGESSPPHSRPPLGRKDERPFCSPARRTGTLNSNHPATAPGSDSVRPPFPTVAMTGVPSANSGHCSAISNVVATLWGPATRYEAYSALLRLLFRKLMLTGLHLTGPVPRARH